MVGLLLLAFAQQGPEVLFRQTEGIAAWTTLGDGSELRTSGSTMVLSYDVAPKKLSGAVMGAPEGFERMRSIRFAIESDHDTAMAVLLSEKKPGGGNYAAWFWAPAHVRQQIELTPADFSVTDGAGDPVDADGKLDLDQVQGIGIFDLAQFFLAMPRNPALPIAANETPGRHTLTVEDFAVVAGADAPRAAAGKSVVLDGFDRTFLDWAALGGMKLQLSAEGNPLGAHAMQASYQPQPGQLGVLVRRIGDPALGKAKRLSFDIASEHEVTLVIALEMKKQGPGGGEGPRFSLPIYPPGGKEVFHVDLDLADFKGPVGAFDPAQWRSLAILDASAAEGGAGESNTIWIGKIEARN
jgi:hypothetical protein